MMASTESETASVGTLVSPFAMPVQRVAELLEGGAGAFADTEQTAELPERDLDSDTGEEADEDAVRQEVGDEPELDQAGNDHQDPAHHGCKSTHRDPLRRGWCAGRRDPAEADRKNRRCGRVRANYQMPRRAEDGECQHGQDERVEAGDDRHLRDVRVAHDLGHGQRGQSGAGDEIRGQTRTIEGEEPLKDRQAPLRFDGRSAGGRGHFCASENVTWDWARRVSRPWMTYAAALQSNRRRFNTSDGRTQRRHFHTATVEMRPAAIAATYSL